MLTDIKGESSLCYEKFSKASFFGKFHKKSNIIQLYVGTCAVSRIIHCVDCDMIKFNGKLLCSYGNILIWNMGRVIYQTIQVLFWLVMTTAIILVEFSVVHMYCVASCVILHSWTIQLSMSIVLYCLPVST